MWTTFCTNDGAFMLKIETDNEEIYKISLMNLKKIWLGCFSRELILQKFQECNPTFDVKMEEAVKQVITLFKQIDKAEVEVKTCDTKAAMYIKSNISEVAGTLPCSFKLNYQLDLPHADEEKFTEMITVPMIYTISFLEEQQKMLCNLLEKKDKELQEYKMEKGNISRTDLITEKFDPNVLTSSSDKLILGVYGKSAKFLERVAKDYGKIKEKIVEVEVEPWNKRKKKRKIYNAETTVKQSGIVYKK